MENASCYPQGFRHICQEAVQCNKCFEGGGLKRPLVDKAQPRWIGSGYAATSPRIVFMLLNPGSGGGRQDGADESLRNLLHRYETGEDMLDQIMQHQRSDIPKWGNGRLMKFLRLSNIDIDGVALMNIAWCASEQNEYPRSMLRSCFERHTLRALVALEPNVVILSGTKTHAFKKEIRRALPHSTTLQTLHYAHRKGHEATLSATEKLRLTIATIRDPEQSGP
ncbi:hypothetical protein [Nioella sp. MMSF_3534]|uniref:hypothetical protein n=1 Tax=Nioella sp. MMSF_3534 TaxID=3046720 RepID=UPI00273E6673|nr:hypothetical protein [Nioella sp. MMSF_3534]